VRFRIGTEQKETSKRREFAAQSSFDLYTAAFCERTATIMMQQLLQSLTLKRRAAAIWQAAEAYQSLSEAELQRRILEIATEIYLGAKDSRYVSDCFSLVVEASARVLGKRHFPVQIMGGLALLRQGVVEMQTGEGKTITAILPVVLRVFRKRGCHVVTSNDYLAQRDADELRPLFEFCGLSVGCVTPELDSDSRRRAYGSDITYGTGSEFGFDYLRDRMTVGPEVSDQDMQRSPDVMQRGHYFALVDEADSVLIDDARTPLIIGAEGEVNDQLKGILAWASRIAAKLNAELDYGCDDRSKQVWLTKKGEQSVALAEKPQCLNGVSTEAMLERIENALTARLTYIRNRDYVIKEGEVVIVSESSGRSMAGRKWQRGLHQAVEAKEGVDVTGESGVASRITIQSYFRRYRMLAGMTGTALPARQEFKSFFRINVLRIPTNRPCVRINRGVRIFADRDSKLTAIVESAVHLAASGRAVLIGIPTVEESFLLSQRFSEAGHDCPVLNAVNHALEAEIIAEAGQSGGITISTNMAGRGTDILLDDAARTAGGLHVILTELHTSLRFDRQLIGRSARQGDPGSFEYLLSLDDSLLTTYAPGLQRKLKAKVAWHGRKLPSSWLKYFIKTQRQLENRNRKDRKKAFKQEGKLSQAVARSGLDAHLEIMD